MADLGNRTNVDTAINLLLDDAQPNDAIQPSDHNGLLKNILDTLANGLSVTLRTNPETGGQDIEITSGDKLKYKSSTFFNSLVTATLTADRTLTFPDKTDTVATLTDVQNIMNTNGLTLAGNYTHDLNSNNLILSGGGFSVGDDFNVTSTDGTKQNLASFISSGSNAVMILDNLEESVVIGTTSPHDSAKLDITSTTKGLLVPRMSTTERNNISTPAESLLIYNTTDDQFEYRTSTATWDALGGGGGASIYTASGTVPSSTVATITDSLTFAGGQIALSSTNDGILLNRVNNSQMAGISATTNEIVFNTESNSLFRYNGSSWVPLAGFGVLSVNSTNGEPTFYTSLTLAIAGASAGDTIEMYGDIIDSSGTTVNFNKELTVNMNGYTYTNSSSGSSDAIQITATDKVKILNGTIKRINGTYATTSNRGLVVGVGSDVELTGTDVINDGGISLYSTSATTKILNGRFITLNQTLGQVSVECSATLTGASFESTAYNNFVGIITNIKATSTTANKISGSDSEAVFCDFRQTSASGYDGLLIVSGAKATHCNAHNVSTSYPAIRIGDANSEMWYCHGYSTLDHGIEVGTGNPKGIYYCTGINETGSGKYGGVLASIDEVKNSTFISVSGDGGAKSSGADILFDSCVFKIEDSQNYKRGFYDSATTGTVRVFNCLSQTAGSLSQNQSMFFTSGRTVYLANNRLKGGTGIDNTNGNSQTSTSDAVGNIILD